MRYFLSVLTLSLVGLLGHANLVLAATIEPGESASLADTGNRMIVITVNDTNYSITAAGDVLIHKLSDAAAPTLIGSYTTTGTASDVAVSADNHYIYVADGYTLSNARIVGHVLVLDISNLTTPTLAADYTQNLGNFNAVELVDNTLYANNSVNGVAILDVSNPTLPTLLGTASGYIGGIDVVSDGTYLYVLLPLSSKVSILNPATPSAVTLVGEITVSLTAERLLADNNVLYIADGEDGLLAYDLTSNLVATTLLGMYNTAGAVEGIVLDGQLAYLADATGGVVALNISNLASMSELATSTAAELASANDVILAGKYLYVLTDTNLYQAQLTFNFTVQGAKDGKVGNVTVYDGTTTWLTIEAYSSKIGAQAFLGDVNNDGFEEVITAPAGKSSKPKLQVFDPITGTLLSKKKLSDSDDKKLFTIGVADYYNPESRAEVLATELNGNKLSLYAYFVKKDGSNKISLKTSTTENPTKQEFIDQGYKIKFNTSNSYPITIQAKQSTDTKVKYKLKKNSDGSYVFQKQS